MSTSRPKYSDVAGLEVLDRAARIAKAIMADPRTPADERDWTVDDVLGVALVRGLDRLEELFIDRRSIEEIRAQAADAAE